MSRLDQALVDRGLCGSRERAKRVILAGQVRVNQRRAEKPSEEVRMDDELVVVTPDKYVSRGGHKLEHALRYFGLNVEGAVVIDLGASTGGFTDCLLQQGARRIYAVDVGQGQLAWKLRQDPRVFAMDKTNARNLTPKHFPPPFEPADLVVVDCSFISLRHLLPAAMALVRDAGRIVVLIKPQFEAGKSEVDRGAGVITDPLVHERVISEIKQFAGTLPQALWRGITESPLLGPAGNKEFLALIEKIDCKI